MIVSLHVTHASTGADIIADIIPSVEAGAEELVSTIGGIDEYIILRTCNRFELYVSAKDPDRVSDLLEEYANQSVPNKGESVLWYILKGKACVRHLFRVTCGLDSLIIGEDQIQGQVKNAYIKAKDEGHLSGLLGHVFERALYTGKRVRTETGLNSGAISMGSAAVELAEEKLGSLRGKNVTIVGAGDMATVIAKNLMEKGPNAVFVSNRTYEHAMELATAIGGKAMNYYNLPDALVTADLVLVATNSPHIILDRDKIEPILSKRSTDLLIIDISVPRNVSDDLNELAGVEVDSMGDINEVAQKNLLKRRDEIAKAERIVNAELKVIREEHDNRMADSTIGNIYNAANAIRSEELCRARARLSAGVDPNEVVDDLSRVIISKLLFKPFERLRSASKEGQTEMCEMASILFGVDE